MWGHRLQCGWGQALRGSVLQPDEWAPLEPALPLSPPYLWQEELEHLNQASEEINQVELQLDVSVCVPSLPWAGPGPLPPVSFPLGHSGGKRHCGKDALKQIKHCKIFVL